MGRESARFDRPLLNRACPFLLNFWPRKLSRDSRIQFGSYYKPGAIPNRQHACGLPALVLIDFNGMDAVHSILVVFKGGRTVIPKHIYFTAVEKTFVKQPIISS